MTLMEICEIVCGFLKCVCPPGYARSQDNDPCKEIATHSAEMLLSGNFTDEFNNEDPRCEPPGSEIELVTTFMKSVMLEAADIAFADQPGLYMDTDIMTMTVLSSRTQNRAGDTQLRMEGTMRFPREAYDNDVLNGGNPAEKMNETLNSNWAYILSCLEDLIPDFLGNNPSLDFNFSSNPQVIPCENNTCHSDANCNENAEGHPPLCNCNTGFEDLNPNFSGRACATMAPIERATLRPIVYDEFLQGHSARAAADNFLLPSS
ncbi:unnamed protein product, partial [Darwinula stevensoni]